MSFVFFLIFLFVLIYVLAKFRLNFKQQSLAFAAFTAVVFIFSLLPAILSWILVIFAAAYVALAFLKPLRVNFLSGKLLNYIGKALPPISDTEQAAIDAGTVWWEAELFRGNPEWNKLHNVPYARLNDEEKAYLEGPVEEFCAMLDDWKITNIDKDLSDEAWQFIKDNKLFGLIIPKKYGGLGFSSMANSEIVMKIASRSGSAGVTVMVPNSLGPGELLMDHGTEAQREYYLPRLASGEEIPCFALTGPWAGSDAGAMMDAGIVCYGEYNGEQVLGFRTSWKKRYITLAPVATIVGLAFKAYDPEGLLGDKEDLGITCALVPASTPGVEIGRRHLPLNAAFMNGPVEAKDVFIPFEWIIGGQEGIGRGWQMLMESLAAGRAISLPASGVSSAKVSSFTSGAYSMIREQFNLPIGKFEAIEEALGRIAGKSYMMDATRLFTLSALMQGEKPSVVSAIAKYHLTEGAREVVIDAMDIHGGKGICSGPSNYLANGYQILPIAITVEGANIMTRSLIIFGQGAMRCHPYLLKEVNLASAERTDAVVDEFDGVLMDHFAYVTANKARAFLYGLTRGRLASAPDSPLANYYKQLARISAGFSFLADTCLLILGGEFKRKEKISARFADALSYMFMCSSVLKRHRDLDYVKEDRALVDWSCQYCLYQAETALYDITKNFPVKMLSPVLRFIIFPTGRYSCTPNDKLGAKAAETIITPGPARDRVTGGIYVKDDAEDVLGSLNVAMNLAIETSELRRELRRNKQERQAYESYDEWLNRLIEVKAIKEDQASLLKDYHEATYRVIKVDDFAPENV